MSDIVKILQPSIFSAFVHGYSVILEERPRFNKQNEDFLNCSIDSFSNVEILSLVYL